VIRAASLAADSARMFGFVSLLRAGLRSLGGCFHLLLQIRDIETPTRLHRRKLDEGGQVFCDDLPRDHEAPGLFYTAAVFVYP
jgi:hypothetical protein